MKEIKEIGDRVTVLKDGTYVGTRNVADVEIDDLVALMVGRKIQGTYLNEEMCIRDSLSPMRRALRRMVPAMLSLLLGWIRAMCRIPAFRLLALI